MRHLYHRSVVLLFEVLEERDEWEGGPQDDGHEGRVCMVLEYMQGGATMSFDAESGLFKRPDGGADGAGVAGAGNAYSEDEAKPLFRDLVQGLLYLHGKNIVHRDIKVCSCVTFRAQFFFCRSRTKAPRTCRVVERDEDEASCTPTLGSCRLTTPAAILDNSLAPSLWLNKFLVAFPRFFGSLCFSLCLPAPLPPPSLRATAGQPPYIRKRDPSNLRLRMRAIREKRASSTAVRRQGCRSQQRGGAPTRPTGDGRSRRRPDGFRGNVHLPLPGERRGGREALLRAGGGRLGSGVHPLLLDLRVPTFPRPFSGARLRQDKGAGTGRREGGVARAGLAAAGDAVQGPPPKSWPRGGP